jgi:alpha-tubulin suppressor-like RCC1 family protein
LLFYTPAWAQYLPGTVVAWGRRFEGQINVPPGLSNVIQIAGGSFHSLALTREGMVVGWGDNTHGQTTVPGELTNAVAIAAGAFHNVALKTDGTVVAWGEKASGQIDVPGLRDVVAVGAGTGHSLALKSDGTVVAWGANDSGQTAVPPDLTNATAIAAGGGHCLALTSLGKVVAWGNNSYGQTNVPACLDNVVAISAGCCHSLALKADGTVVGWGRNDFGQAGPPSGVSNIVAVAASDGIYNLALTAAGRVIAWGGNSGYVPADLTNAVAIGIGGEHSLAIAGDGAPVVAGVGGQRSAYRGSTVLFRAGAVGAPPLGYIWRFNGALIVQATNSFLVVSNVQEAHLGTYTVVVTNDLGVSTNVTTLESIVDGPPIITAHPESQNTYPGATIVLRVVAEGSGPLQYQWLFNGDALSGATNATLMLRPVSFAQVGRYAVEVKSALGVVCSSNAVLTIPPVIAWGGFADPYPHCGWVPASAPPDLTNAVEVAGGYWHSLALRSDGTVTAWGLENQFCALYGPTRVPPGLSNVVAIAAGGYDSLALKSDGTVVPWGRATNVPAGLTNVIAITASKYYGSVLALKADGTVASWGGSGSLTNVPPSVTNVVGIASGTSHNLALRGDGTVVAWGYLPGTNVPPGLSNVVAIAAGRMHGLALTAEGLVVGWGLQVPVVPEGLSNVVALSAGHNHSSALKADGTVVVWGGTGPPSGLTNVVAIASGGFHTLAIVSPYQIVPWNRGVSAHGLWLSGGDAPWFGQTNVTREGPEALQSGAIKHDQRSSLKTTVTGPGVVKFSWKVSSEAGRDPLRFYQDGVERAAISGEVDWEQRAFALQPRPQTLEWVYAKDASGTDGRDAGWVDDFIVIPNGTLEPVITTQPDNFTVWVGSSVTLRISVAGVSPFRYQWQHNGADLAGATNASLTLAQAQISDSGVYTVVVTNAYGSASSADAIVTVLASPPLIVTQPTNQVTYLGRPAVFQAVVDGPAPCSFQWLFEGVDLAGATNAALVLPSVRFAQAGQYSLRVSNVYGLSVSSNATLSVVPVLAWGRNDHGQTNLLAIQSNAVALAAGLYHSLALRSDGSIAAWGSNDGGQTAVPASATNAVAVAAGARHNLALLDNHTVIAWGANAAGQASVPTGLSNVVAAAGGLSHSLALRADGSVVGWGDNSFGQTTMSRRA